ncbi:translation initiation factor IF-2-like [Panicum virgatum]|uniref:translation initiation factor IF-2-like n=1 Tax=Panicum virgatum TaxID=38727 RepID=UPI0019D549FC|nr:translation initiation factor IF-2-like [Panicum virgatum]
MPLAPPPAAAQPPIARLPSPHPPLQLCTGARRRSHPTSCGPWSHSDPPRLCAPWPAASPAASQAGRQPSAAHTERRTAATAPRLGTAASGPAPTLVASGAPQRASAAPRPAPPGTAPRLAAPPRPSSPPALPGRPARRAGGCLRPSTARLAPKLRIVAGGPARRSCTQARVPLPSPS